jgi:hypothetical protein
MALRFTPTRCIGDRVRFVVTDCGRRITGFDTEPNYELAKAVRSEWLAEKHEPPFHWLGASATGE